MEEQVLFKSRFLVDGRKQFYVTKKLQKGIYKYNKGKQVSLGWVEYIDNPNKCPKPGQEQPTGPGTWMEVEGECIWIPM